MFLLQGTYILNKKKSWTRDFTKKKKNRTHQTLQGLIFYFNWPRAIAFNERVFNSGIEYITLKSFAYTHTRIMHQPPTPPPPPLPYCRENINDARLLKYLLGYVKSIVHKRGQLLYIDVSKVYASYCASSTSRSHLNLSPNRLLYCTYKFNELCARKKVINSSILYYRIS